MVGAEGDGDRALAEADGEGVTYGLAEFVAAEEMSRSRGFWWSPESDRLLVARVDDTPVQRWWISDPAHPGRDPQHVPYPAAGTPNADVRLFVVGLDGGRTEVLWDRARYPYLARVHWSAAGAPLLLVQARDQRSQLFLAVDTESGTTRMVHADEDPIWLELFPGVPYWSPSGQLVRIADEGGARVLAVGERLLTGAQLHLRAVLDVGADDVLVSASAGEEAAEAEIGEVHVYRVNELGVERLSQEPGVHSAVRAGGVTVLVSATLDRPGARVRVLRDGKAAATIASYAEDPGLSPRVTLTQGGARRVPCAVLMPTDYHGDTPSRSSWTPTVVRTVSASWPRTTPTSPRSGSRTRGSRWSSPTGGALRGAPRLGEGRQGRRGRCGAPGPGRRAARPRRRLPAGPGPRRRPGWSFGGYLAALAALRRPDVFHAAVVGAPVTDLRLYDTHYQERYLGDPGEQPDVYRRNSVIDDAGLVDAAEPHRPMMVIHGLADDNVVVAHSLRLSSALLAAGRPHEVLPLSGVTHMTPQESVAENLLRLQVDFLKRSLPAPA